MNDTTRLRGDVLTALDTRFETQGFRRRRDSFAWRRPVTPGLVHSLHLNFGLYRGTGTLVAHPSVGARYDVIEAGLLAAGVIAHRNPERATFGRMLASLTGNPTYQTDVASGAESLAETVWADWCAAGRSYLEELSDLERVIALLESPESQAWCCVVPGDRARLLPLALAAVGRRREALAALDRLRSDCGSDQLLPPFEQFAAWFRAQAT
jgi:hypothetical protein